jgi:hypothetical protein
MPNPRERLPTFSPWDGRLNGNPLGYGGLSALGCAGSLVRGRAMIMHFNRQVLTYHDAETEVAISHPRLRALYDLWNTKRGSRQAPPRSDFSHEDLLPWFGHLMLLDCLNGSDCRYRLYGTALVGLFGFDLTGQTVRAAADRIGDKPMDEYSKVMRIGAPVYTSRISPSAREYLQVDKLALPLMEGGVVTKILGAIYLSDPANEYA